jgi:hypothetical protein
VLTGDRVDDPGWKSRLFNVDLWTRLKDGAGGGGGGRDEELGGGGAAAAVTPDDEWAREWARILAHFFAEDTSKHVPHRPGQRKITAEITDRIERGLDALRLKF